MSNHLSLSNPADCVLFYASEETLEKLLADIKENFETAKNNADNADDDFFTKLNEAAGVKGWYGSHFDKMLYGLTQGRHERNVVGSPTRHKMAKKLVKDRINELKINRLILSGLPWSPEEFPDLRESGVVEKDVPVPE